MIKRNYLKFLLLAGTLIFPLMSFGVTKEEMEQARVIAAKAYIRYVNDGSGYLDDLNPKTMEELEASLKPKEKENIKAFKAIPVPSDYKDWGKEKLVEYWAVTAFQNKGLLEKGLGGRIRARSQINKMTLSTPKPEPAAQPTAATTPAPASNSASSAVASDSTSVNQGEILTDEQKLNEDEDALDADMNIEKATNYTWVYIMVLAILVAIVIALVVYANNVFKKNGMENDHGHRYADDSEHEEEMERLESSVADKNMEISMLNKKIETLTRQNNELKSKVESLNSELMALRSASAEKRVAPRQEPEPETAPRQKASVRSIYLGRANAKGIFVRADRTLNVGNSVFVLDTSDGYSGSFRVADSPAAWSLALSNPKEYLETACTGYDLDDTASASRIITEASGTAVFEGGCWRVIRKAKIKYE